MPETKENSQTEVDERGVPLANKVKELERKLQDKYEKELAENRRELEELKARFNSEDEKPEEKPGDTAKAELMEFVKNPRAFIKSAATEENFARQVPDAEDWIRNQPGYSKEDDLRILQIVQENGLNGAPMQRARTAWKILSVEKKEKELSTKTDEAKREAAISKTSGDGEGKSISKKTAPSRADLIAKLAEASRKGDLDAEVRLTGMLEDVRE